MMPRNVFLQIIGKDDLIRSRYHTARLFHNVINRSQVACLNMHEREFKLERVETGDELVPYLTVLYRTFKYLNIL